DLRIEIEQDRQIRRETAGRDLRERAELREWQARAVALIGERRVGESGTHDDLARGQRRSQDLADELGPGGIEEERVGPRLDPAGVLQQQAPQPLAEPRPAGLA